MEKLTINLEIDGKAVEAAAGAMLIEVTDQRNIHVPRFCYHKNLPIAANCRMCLVEVEKAPKPLPACATPIVPGMKVWTKSAAVIAAQKSVLEFLLINHPLDCPICDQGGECELQDLTLQYGSSCSRFNEPKRVIIDKNLGPLIKTDLTRCIQCTRCVRFGETVAGFKELGATNRGEHLEIGTFIEKNVTSEVSGNIIDLCPVGALTSKPFAYRARSWELTQVATISPHDCVGSNIYVHTRNNQVMRVVARENPLINEVWLADRDRFSYEGLYSKDRLIEPKIKLDGTWHTVSLDEAIKFIANKLQPVINGKQGSSIGALASPSSTTEELYLLQKLVRSLGSNNIDHRLRQLDFKDESCFPLAPGINGSFAELKQAEHILLVGSNIHKEQPIIGLHLRKNTLQGGKISVINPIDFTMNFNVEYKIIPDKGDLLSPLLDIVNCLLKKDTNTIAAPYQELASAMLNTKNAWIILGSVALNHPQAASLYNLCKIISEITGHKIGILTEGGNAAGAWLSGCVPHRLPAGEACSVPGLNAKQMLSKPLAAYLLLGIEPNLDSCMGAQAVANLAQADLVVALTAFAAPSLLECADVLLPITTWLEMTGTYINCTNTWQTTLAAVSAGYGIQPAWQIITQIADALELKEFNYTKDEDIVQELKSKLENASASSSPLPTKLQYPIENPVRLFRVATTPLYAVDMFVRRAKALASTQDAISADLAILNIKHEFNTNKIAIYTQENKIINQVKISQLVPENTLWLNQGIPNTASIAAADYNIEIKEVC